MSITNIMNNRLYKCRYDIKKKKGRKKEKEKKEEEEILQIAAHFKIDYKGRY